MARGRRASTAWSIWRSSLNRAGREMSFAIPLCHRQTPRRRSTWPRQARLPLLRALPRRRDRLRSSPRKLTASGSRSAARFAWRRPARAWRVWAGLGRSSRETTAGSCSTTRARSFSRYRKQQTAPRSSLASESSSDRPSLISHAPGRALRPSAQGLLCPFNRLLLVAQGAWVRNVERLRRRRGDEAERMGVDLHIPKRLFDQRHVARHALGPDAIQLVMRMSGNAVGERADRRVGSVAAEAKRVPFLAQHGDVVAAVRIVT